MGTLIVRIQGCSRLLVNDAVDESSCCKRASDIEDVAQARKYKITCCEAPLHCSDRLSEMRLPSPVSPTSSLSADPGWLNESTSAHTGHMRPMLCPRQVGRSSGFTSRLRWFKLRGSSSRIALSTTL